MTSPSPPADLPCDGASFSTLPTEIKVMIVQMVKESSEPRPPHVGSRSTGACHPPSDLSMLSCCSRELHDLALPLVFETVTPRHLWKLGRYYSLIKRVEVDSSSVYCIRSTISRMALLPNLTQLLFHWNGATRLFQDLDEIKWTSTERATSSAQRRIELNQEEEITLSRHFTEVMSRVTHLELIGYPADEVQYAVDDLPVLVSLKSDSWPEIKMANPDWDWEAAWDFEYDQKLILDSLERLQHLSLASAGLTASQWRFVEEVGARGALTSLELDFSAASGAMSDDSDDDSDEDVSPDMSKTFSNLNRLRLTGSLTQLAPITEHLSESPLTHLTLILTDLRLPPSHPQMLQQLFWMDTLRHLMVRYAPLPLEVPDINAPSHLSSEESRVLRHFARTRPSLLYFDDQALEPEVTDEVVSNARNETLELLEWAQRRVEGCVGVRNEFVLAEMMEAMNTLRELRQMAIDQQA